MATDDLAHIGGPWLSAGERILILRRRYGMSQSDVAGLAGVSPRTVSNWEFNTAVPNMDAARILEQYFDVPMGWLVGSARRVRASEG